MYNLSEPTLEDWFGFWLEDLITRGYILKVLRASEMVPFVLFEGLKSTYNVKNKKVYVERTKTLLEKITYAPDFVIIWDKSAEGLFYINFLNDTYSNTKLLSFTHNGLDYTPLEIKAPPGYGGKNSSDASFRVKQKWVWEKYQILVQKVYLYPLTGKKAGNKYLWCNTFTPTRYFKTDKLTKFRSIKAWDPVHVDIFIQNQKASLQCKKALS